MPKVDSSLVGDVWPVAAPGKDPVMYGSVALSPHGSFETCSFQTFEIVYTVGLFLA